MLRFAALARRPLALAVALAVLATACEIVPYVLLVRAVADLVAGTATAAELGWLAAMTAAATLGRFALAGLSGYASHAASFDVVCELRRRMAARLARLPLGWFESRRSGEATKVMTSDAERLEGFLAHAIPETTSAGAIWIAVTAWLVAVDPIMGLATLAVVALAFALLRQALRDSGAHVQAVSRAEAAMNGSLVEILDGIDVIKAFGHRGRAFTTTSTAIEAYRAAQVRWVRSFLARGSPFFVVVVSATAIILPVGLILHLNGKLDTETLLLFLVVGPGAATPLLRCYHQALGLALRMRSARLIDDVLQARAPEDSGVRVPLGERDVAFDGVSAGYGGADVVRDVTFDAPAGAITALVGPSGAGKSTLAGLVARFLDPTAGAVRIGGVDVRAMSVEQLMEEVTFVFQDPFCFHDTIAANVAMGDPRADRDALHAAARAARVDEIVDRLPGGWDALVGARGATLSGGERQRVALARALLKPASIVVLDEATAFADPDSEAAIQDALAELLQGRTTIVVAHRLHTVVDVDRIVVVEAGRVVDHGTHDELVDRCDLYRRMWSDAEEAESIAIGTGQR